MMRGPIDIPVGQNPLAQAIAEAMLDGFDKHYRLFREASRLAKERFEAGEWLSDEFWKDAGELCPCCLENRAKLSMMYIVDR